MRTHEIYGVNLTCIATARVAPCRCGGTGHWYTWGPCCEKGIYSSKVILCSKCFFRAANADEWDLCKTNYTMFCINNNKPFFPCLCGGEGRIKSVRDKNTSMLIHYIQCKRCGALTGGFEDNSRTLIAWESVQLCKSLPALPLLEGDADENA